MSFEKNYLIYFKEKDSSDEWMIDETISPHFNLDDALELIEEEAKRTPYCEFAIAEITPNFIAYSNEQRNQIKNENEERIIMV